eukprot:38762-Chlamydomonas_euryale.AAC.2
MFSANAAAGGLNFNRLGCSISRLEALCSDPACHRRQPGSTPKLSCYTREVSSLCVVCACTGP